MSRSIRWGLLLLPLVCLLTAGCKEDKPSRKSEEARIEREVERRMAAERRESDIRAQRLRTLRVLGFLVLSGGALGTLIWCGWPRDAPRGPAGPAGGGSQLPILRHPPRGGRVIDLRQPPRFPRSDHETPRRP